MKLTKLSAIAAAISLAGAPVALQAASEPAPMTRASAPIDGESELGGIGAAGVILALAAIGMGALIIADDDDEAVSN
jgi:hypothetical protein|tara:strand:- start:1432 stop:1662 length:231 start_codon:yes stop_codon:yes gene_type:complete